MIKNRDTQLALRILARIQQHSIDAPILGHNLAAEFNTTVRMIADVVEQLRDGGHKIGSNKGKPMGYFLARSPEELSPSIERLRSTAKEIFARTNRMADWGHKEPTIFEQQLQPMQ